MTARQRQLRQKRRNHRKLSAKTESAMSGSASTLITQQQPSQNGGITMNRLDERFNFQQTAIGLRAQRQSVIASNIANADTPNYKARDMDFGAALSGAMQGRAGQPLALSMTTSRHIPFSGVASAPHLQFRPEQQASVDGNTVNMDAERSAMAENTLYYEASVTFINGLIKSMHQAVSGQT